MQRPWGETEPGVLEEQRGGHAAGAEGVRERGGRGRGERGGGGAGRVGPWAVTRSLAYTKHSPKLLGA